MLRRICRIGDSLVNGVYCKRTTTVKKADILLHAPAALVDSNRAPEYRNTGIDGLPAGPLSHQCSGDQAAQPSASLYLSRYTRRKTRPTLPLPSRDRMDPSTSALDPVGKPSPAVVLRTSLLRPSTKPQRQAPLPCAKARSQRHVSDKVLVALTALSLRPPSRNLLPPLPREQASERQNAGVRQMRPGLAVAVGEGSLHVLANICMYARRGSHYCCRVIVQIG